ncbi:hypothetical protein FRACA_300002 [Frankia canadensis]|uniref:Uncharacterized protein n=1 Tax=Frankia canadensis TaxID=1836972 RepID=A0A2I2KTW7_9ACTN|nr:hypothetical protein FRACA_300002 [Frankia canadensis]SOU56396.1 hypothetical protein FRACA_300002 [Frankia canadensis]
MPRERQKTGARRRCRRRRAPLPRGGVDRVDEGWGADGVAIPGRPFARIAGVPAATESHHHRGPPRSPAGGLTHRDPTPYKHDHRRCGRRPEGTVWASTRRPRAARTSRGGEEPAGDGGAVSRTRGVVSGLPPTSRHGPL